MRDLWPSTQWLLNHPLSFHNTNRPTTNYRPPTHQLSFHLPTGQWALTDLLNYLMTIWRYELLIIYMPIWRYEFLHWIYILEFSLKLPEAIMRFDDIKFHSRFPPGQFGSPEVLKNKNVNLYLKFSFATWPFNQVVKWLSKRELLILIIWLVAIRLVEEEIPRDTIRLKLKLKNLCQNIFTKCAS